MYILINTKEAIKIKRLVEWIFQESVFRILGLAGLYHVEIQLNVSLRGSEPHKHTFQIIKRTVLMTLFKPLKSQLEHFEICVNPNRPHVSILVCID